MKRIVLFDMINMLFLHNTADLAILTDNRYGVLLCIVVSVYQYVEMHHQKPSIE